MDRVADYNRASAIAFVVLGTIFYVPVLGLFNMKLAGEAGLSIALISMVALGGGVFAAALFSDKKLKTKFKMN
ncbi:hypothetical protein HFO56_01095 [Rhizobium laguerreae]|uniref:hypothetical protein n=1 Tax=Rhizobium laguerreae TaxID=1076926 RepID=UPI001C91A55B|nr:hypothetical protein [Rhizobium laguerreae]MBY3151026.1 hypothetical protein [Rhizobium laguerreae]